jgi:hypothetical protein
MRSARITAAGITVLLTAGLVAGCTSAPTEGASTPAATPVATATPDASSTPDTTPAAAESAPAHERGDTIEADEAEALPEGKMGYELPDGSIVVVEADKKLPKPVRKAIENEIEALYEMSRNPNGGMTALPKRTKRLSGKSLLIVTQMIGGTDADPFADAPQWVIYGGRGLQLPPNGWTRAGAVGAAKEFIARQDNSDHWELIVRG